MAFEAYKPIAGNTLGHGKWISIGASGLINVSSELAKSLGITEDSRHELYFDKESNQIGIKFVPAGTNGHSRALIMNSGNLVSMNGAAFFRQFKIKTPAKSLRFTPKHIDGMLVIEYPDALVPKA